MHFSYLILGAGVAGLSLAHSLIQRGQKVAVVDKNGVASGASGTPAALINPVTGRRARLCWHPEACYHAVVNLVRQTEIFCGFDLLSESGLFRPALTEKMAAKMEKSFRKQQWPDEWVEWQSEEEIKKYSPHISCKKGGLWVKISMSLDMGLYMNELAGMLKNRGVKIIENVDYELFKEEKGWTLKFKKGEVSAGNMVFATGHSGPSSKYWSDIPLHPLKGQIAVFSSGVSLGTPWPVSSLGYFIPLDSNTIAAGSTYEHHFTDDGITDKGAEVLYQKVVRTFPYLKDELNIEQQWAGIRASTPNKLPVAGRHKNLSGMYLFAGLGSKGLLYGKYISTLLADYMIENRPLPSEIDIKRFY